MTDATPLDLAHAAMAEGGDAPERAYFARLADTEVFVLLEAEAEGDAIRPRVFALEDGPVVLAFDREHRLAAFAEGPAPYAALSGRALARMLAGQGLGLGINLTSGADFLLPAAGVDWLAEVLVAPVAEAEARLSELTPPRGVPEGLLQALDAQLARAGALARQAYLVGARYGEGQGHLVAFIGARAGAEPTLARAVAEALRFSGLDAGALDVVFLAEGDALVARLARVGLRFDLPEVAAPEPAIAPAAPGSDPNRPPRLR
jgi:hypothetical protein